MTLDHECQLLVAPDHRRRPARPLGLEAAAGGALADDVGATHRMGGTLADFPNFADWPSQALGFAVEFPGAPAVPATRTSPARMSRTHGVMPNRPTT